MHSFIRTAARLLLLTVVALAVTSCKTQEKPPPTPLPGPVAGSAPAWIAGEYKGFYTLGHTFAERAGETVGFVLTLHQVPGSSQVTGTMRERAAGFALAGGRYLSADVTGTCVREGDVIHLRFSKTYRRSKRPVENYLGSLPAGSTLLTGIWYDAETSSGSGTFQLDTAHVD